MPSLMDLLKDEEPKTPELDQPEQAEPPFDFGSYLANAIEFLSDAQISPMDLPEKERHAAFALEPQIHDAETENRHDDFIRLVDQWKQIFVGGYCKRIMDSKVIGKAELVFNLDDPDSVMVDGVKYSGKKELQNLLLKKKQMKMDAEALRRIHETKKFFAGSILADNQVKEMNARAYKLSRW